MRSFKALSCVGAISACALGLATPARALFVPTQADLTTSLAATRFTGVGTLGVLAQGTAYHACTGALVATNVVLTAAHCLSSFTGYQFLLPAAGDYNLAGGTAFAVHNGVPLPRYRGSGDSDIALLTLDRPAVGHAIYDLYTDHDELGKTITIVGAGVSGTLPVGFDPAAPGDSRLRAGVNRYDATGTQLPAYADGTYDLHGDDVLMFDNDDGSSAHDVFGRYLGAPDTGVRIDGKTVDAGIFHGDSGGPDFIDGKIAGVHSFGSSGSLFETETNEGCGPGSVDYVVPRSGSCTDGSYGDFGGSVRVSFYADAIRAYINAAAVPEPASWATMLAGFGAIGAGLRRHRPGRAALA